MSELPHHNQIRYELIGVIAATTDARMSDESVRVLAAAIMDSGLFTRAQTDAWYRCCTEFERISTTLADRLRTVNPYRT